MIDNPTSDRPAASIASHIQQAIQLHSKGSLSEAEKMYRDILRQDPDQSEALHYLGVLAFQVGQLEEAEKLISRALSQVPEYTEAHCNLGLVLNKLGKVKEAVVCFDRAIGLSPDHAPAHFNRANSLQRIGRIDEAISGYQKAVSLKKDFAEAHYNLGILFETKEELNSALACYREAVDHRPEYVDALTNLGGLYLRLSEFEKALQVFRAVVLQTPDKPQAFFNLAQAVQQTGDFQEAEVNYRHALERAPEMAEAHNNLGVVLKELGRLDEAKYSYQRAVSIRQDYDEAYYNLGNIEKDLNRLSDALANYQKAVEINPQFAEAWFSLAITCQELGLYEAAKDHMQKAVNLSPDKLGWRVRDALVLPIIYKSKDDLESKRDQLISDIEHLGNQELTISDPGKSVGASNFFFAYHNKGDRSLVQKMAALYSKACPGLMFRARHCNKPKHHTGKRHRIGFLSAYFRAHTIGRLNVGFIEKLPRDRFEVIVIHSSSKKDDMARRINDAADQVVVLQKDMAADRETIAGLELDLLFYPEIGMDAYTYFLAFSRLAPVQAVTWGHPDTTGLLEMDYFVSSRLLETEDAQAEYSEKLTELSVLPTYYERPERPGRGLGRADFEVPTEGTLYLCPQTLFKFHPDFDEILRRLLERDPEAHLVLIDDGKGGNWRRLLEERWSQLDPVSFKRAFFIEQLAHQKFLGLLGLADVVLDIPAFSGGNSSLEAFAMGVPVVTWPGRFMRSRVTAGNYKQMGLEDLVVSDADAYVETAFRLAHDKAYRAQITDAIETNCPKLFQCEAAVRELAAFFEEAIESARVGE